MTVAPHRWTAVAGWSVATASSFYFVWANASRFLSYDAHAYGSDYWPRYAPWLLIHVLAGLVAVAAGPVQFVPAFRKRFPQWHRSVGKAYLTAVMVAGCTALYLALSKMLGGQRLVVDASGLAAQACAWLLTSCMAYWAVRRRNWQQHMEWMVRSYVTTCAFTSSRLLYKLMVGTFHSEPVATGSLLVWACWAVPLLVTEAVLQGRKISNTATEAVPVAGERQEPTVGVPAPAMPTSAAAAAARPLPLPSGSCAAAR